MRAVLVVLVVLVGSVGRVDAQPGNAPPPPPSGYAPAPPPPASGPVAGEKSPGTALLLSLGGTVASLALMGVAEGAQNDGIGAVGGIGVWVAPSFGHWYSGKLWTDGLTLRFAGAGAIIVGAVLLIGDCINDEVGCDDETPAFVLIVGGAGAFVAGGIYDIATAPGAAHRHNERLRARASYGWAVAPMVTRDRAGLVVGGSF
jgi:hypothetical protein